MEKLPKPTKEESKVPSPEEFRDKTSVRTTFQLSQETLDSLTALTQKYKITLKELFETLCASWLWFAVIPNPPQTTDQDPATPSPSVRRTFVISRGSFKKLNEFSKEQKIHRDLVVEKMVKAYKQVSEAKEIELGESKAKHSEALTLIEGFKSQAYEIERRLKEFLIVEDPVYQRWQVVEIVIENLIGEIQNEIENGTPVNPDAM